MKNGHIARTLVSGAALYLVMAACGASDRAGSVAADGGAVDAEQLVDAFVDGLVDPVPPANAETLPPDVATEPCNKILKYSGQDWYVAEHAYPGKTAAQLALVRGMAESTALAGYTHTFSVLVSVRDGGAAAPCNSVLSGQSNLSMTFVLPR